MSTIYDWQKYINLLHEHALVEDDLRDVRREGGEGYEDADRILFERFGA